MQSLTNNVTLNRPDEWTNSQLTRIKLIKLKLQQLTDKTDRHDSQSRVRSLV